MSKQIKASAFLAFYLTATSGYPQTPDTFNPAPNGAVYAVAVQGDGKVLVGGDFTRLAGQARSGLARLNEDGTLDSTLNASASWAVQCLAVQPDGRILVGGSFLYLSDLPRAYIARLSAEGVPEGDFNPGAGSVVNALALQPDGRIVVGGSFTALAGQPCYRLGRLTANGSFDNDFSGGASNTVYAVTLQPDGGVLVGGAFRTLAGQPCNRIGRFDAAGNFDFSFYPEANGTVRCLVVQPDGKILVGGSFTTLGGWPCARIARLNSDGTVETDFLGSASNTVYSIALQADGKIFVGGDFMTLAGNGCSHLGRLKRDGSFDPTFNPGASNSVLALAMQADGKMLVGGSFTNIGGFSRTNLARFEPSLAATQSLSFANSKIRWLRDAHGPEVWRTTFEASTNQLGWFDLGSGTRIDGGWEVSDGGILSQASVRARGYITGGQHNSSGGIIEQMIGKPVLVSQPVNQTNDAGTATSFKAVAVGAPPLDYRWQKDGAWLADGSGTSGTRSSTLVLSSVFGADVGEYSIVVGNEYGSMTGAVATLMVIDPVFTLQPASQAVNPGQTALFQASAVGSEPLLLQWLKNGTNLSGATMASLPFLAAQRMDAAFYQLTASNTFGCITSTPAALSVNCIETDGWNPGAIFPQIPTRSPVAALVPQLDGKTIAAGEFLDLAGSMYHSYIGRLDSEGGLDLTFPPANYGYGSASEPVYAVVLQPDDRILVGGVFTALVGQARQRLGRWNPDGTVDQTFGLAASGTGPGWSYAAVYALVMQGDGRFLAGGVFEKVGGVAHTNLARFDGSGAVDHSFSPAAIAESPGEAPGVQALAVQPDGKILVGGGIRSLCGQPRGNIGRLNPNGTLDSAFDPGADRYVKCISVQPDGKILVGGAFDTLAGVPCNYLGRLNADGTLDKTFNAGVDLMVYALALQADGKIIVGGWFSKLGGLQRSCIGRLHPDGSPDLIFNPGADHRVEFLGLQADGKILTGGGFRNLGGLPREYYGRLNNTDPAVATLAFDGWNLTWSRGGASPEIWHATFESSTDGVDWQSLGIPERVSGGWQLSGVTLSPNATVRARGYVMQSSSSWFAQSTLSVSPQTPAILLHDEAFGWRSNRFGFNVSGGAGQFIVVEGSANLVDWTSLTTITLTNKPFYFSDPSSPALPSRFYRARVQ